MAGGLLSREQLFDQLKSMDPVVLASLLIHGGLSTANPVPTAAMPHGEKKAFNLGKTVSDWKDGPTFAGNLQENLGRWLEDLQEGFRLWMVPDEYKVPFAAAFL